MKHYTMTTIFDGTPFSYTCTANSATEAVEKLDDYVRGEIIEAYGQDDGEDVSHSGWIVSMVITNEAPQRIGEYS